MTPAELAREVASLQARLRSTKRALNVLRGQQRTAVQLLADLDDELHALRRRLESTAEQEAQGEHDNEFRGVEIFHR